MIKRDSCASSLKQLFGSVFYDPWTRPDSPETIMSPQLVRKRSLPRCLTDTVLRALYMKSQSLKTRDGTKLLVLYQSSLIWFESDQNKIPSKMNTSIQANMTSRKSILTKQIDPNRKGDIVPAIEGFIDLKGFTADTHQTKDSQAFIGRMMQSELEPTGKLSASGTRTRTLTTNPLESSNNSIAEYSALMRSDSPEVKKSPGKSRYYIHLKKHADDRVGELIFFDSSQRYEDWRRQLALLPVLFTDFESRYTVLDQHAKEGSRRILKVQNNATDEVLAARVYEVGGGATSGSEAATAQLKSQLLQEASTLIRLRDSGVALTFRELTVSAHAFVLVEEPLDAVPFSEWFSNTWCPEYGDHKDPGPVLSLMIDLTALVVSMSGLGIAHGNICKENLFVKILPPSFESATTPLQGPSRPSLFPPEPSAMAILSPMIQQSSYLQNLLEARISLAHLNRRESKTTSSSMFRKSLNTFRLILKGFGQESSNRKNFLVRRQDSSPNLSDVKYLLPSDQPTQEGDIYSLGLLFVEVLYGVDLRKASFQTFGVEPQIVRSLNEGSTDFISGLEPLYNIDSRVVEMLVRMLDAEPVKRPRPAECQKLLALILHECRKQNALQSTPQAQRSTIVSRQISEGLWSGINSFNRRKESFKMGNPLLSSSLGMHDFGSSGKELSAIDYDRSAVRRSSIRIAQDHQRKEPPKSRIPEAGPFEAVPKTKPTYKPDSANELREYDRVSPGTHIRRLQLSVDRIVIPAKTNDLKFAKSKSLERVSLKYIPAIVPAVCLSGREYFRSQNKLSSVSPDEAALDANESKPANSVRKSSGLLDASCRSISLNNYMTFGKNKHRSNPNSSLVESLSVSKRRSLQPNEVVLGSRLKANLNELSSVFSLADKPTGKFANELDQQSCKESKKITDLRTLTIKSQLMVRHGSSGAGLHHEPGMGPNVSHLKVIHKTQVVMTPGCSQAKISQVTTNIEMKHG